MTDKVKAIIDPSFKSGTNAKGQQWTIKKISLESGKDATTFDELEPGDTVTVVYDEKYDQYKASKPKASDLQHEQVMKALKQLYKLNAEIAKMVGVEGADAKEDKIREVASEVKDEISVDDIPF